MIGVGFIGKYTGGANFSEVAGEFALQVAIGHAAKVDVIVSAERAKIFAARVVVVVAHAAVTGDAAVHLMVNKRPQVLVDVGAFAEAVAAAVVAGHHRHILQVAVAALSADRAVVGVVGHQPFHHALRKLLASASSIAIKVLSAAGSWDITDDRACRFRRCTVSPHTLAAGTPRSQCRVPAEIGNIKAEV